MNTRRIWRMLALLFAFALIAAACGSDDDDSSDSDGDDTQTTAAPSGDDTTNQGGVGSDEEGTASSAARSAADFATLDELFADAAENRARIVAELTEGINSGDYGVGDDNILRGPAGFQIDLNNCPGDWDDRRGITGSEIRIGHTTAQSGTLAFYGDIANGWDNYMLWINENDPVMVDGSPRDLTLIVKDDAYIAAQTIEFVDELIESENVFAITTLGSPNTLAVYDEINRECIPQPYVLTGHPAWGDPVQHPWTSGLQLNYGTEAILWGEWIRDNVPNLPVKVGALVMDNDFGLSYEIAFEDWAEANPDVVSEFHPTRHDPAAATITNEVTTISATDPDVYISMTAGIACPLAIQEVVASGLFDTLEAAFTPSVCKAIEASVRPAGDAANGWWIVGGGGKDSTDPQYADEPFIQFINANLEAAGLDPAISLYATGYVYGYPYVETMKIAAALPGGLSRTNFVLALRSTEIYHPLLLDGIAFAANGAEDGYFVEGSDYSQFDVAATSWNIRGDVVDASGNTPNCAWDKTNGGCR